jgi:Uma2 family endonuclease
MASPAVQFEPEVELARGLDTGLDTACDGQNDGRTVSLEQYLHTIYSPDCDFIDGHLEERNMGELDHGDLQTEIAYIFRSMSPEWRVKAVVELRLQVRPQRFRIPDLMVLHPGQARTQIIREAPLLCIEVLSPEDTFKRLREKVDDYLHLGVEHIWAFDPASREVFRCDAGGFHKVITPDLGVPNTPISLNLNSIFSILDDR